jgi:hypothetical protein
MYRKNGFGKDSVACETCRHLCRVDSGISHYFKCGEGDLQDKSVVRTDWRPGWPACGKHKEKEENTA